MRHRDSTLFAQFEMADEQRSFFYSHMGHSAEINKLIYQCPAGVKELQEIGSYLQSIDCGNDCNEEIITSSASTGE